MNANGQVASRAVAWIRRWLTPTSDSITAYQHPEGVSTGGWIINFVWTLWYVVDALFNPLAREYWMVTIFGFVATVVLAWLAFTRAECWMRAFGVALIALGLAVIPYNHSGGVTSLVYACVVFVHYGRTSQRIALAVAVWLIFILDTLWLQGWPLALVVSLSLMMMGVVASMLMRELAERRGAELRLSHDEIRHLAATAERERIGRDLHDLLGHTLSLIALKSELANRLFDRDAAMAKREMTEVERVARDALAQVRRAVTGIRAAGIAAEVVSAKLLLEANGVRLDCALADVGLPMEIETALAMTVREAVTNIQRHARATQARIVLAASAGNVMLSIEDDGRGGAIVPGNGLGGMRERLDAVGVRLTIESQRGKGTRLVATVPFVLPARSDDAAPDFAAREMALKLAE
ncbi:MAG: sensor histidine kinase [Proteobacteria bacterium]|nr:sensor histidine kinase [Pseudomonadota bacterium]